MNVVFLLFIVKQLLLLNPEPVSSQWQMVTYMCLDHASFGGSIPMVKDMVSSSALSLLLESIIYFEFLGRF